MILAPDGAETLPAAGLPGPPPPPSPPSGRGHAADGGRLPEGTLKEVEREAILRTLDRTGWNVSQTARELGLTRRSLYRRIEEHGL